MLTPEDKKVIDAMFLNVCRETKSIYYDEGTQQVGTGVRYVRLVDVIREINVMMETLKKLNKEQVNG